MSTSAVPLLLARLVDDAAVFPPGSARLADALAAHHRHRAAWYAPVVGPLLVRPDDLADLRRLGPVPGQPRPGGGGATSQSPLRVGVVGDLRHLADVLAPGPVDVVPVDVVQVDVVQVETAVGKRGEDPLPGLRQLLTLAEQLPQVDVFAEIPLTWGLLAALDLVAEARAAGGRVGAKFRTGGLAAELFPTPAELAAVICACAEREMSFKLTAGLHRAVRHNDPETGFTHHGFLNVLAASVLASGGAEVDRVADRLAATDAGSLVDVVASRRFSPRTLWTGFGSCSVAEPLDDLRALGLLVPPAEAVG